ncbi:hypothetical protein RJ639_007651 [Escallonia herrerae]|uniref:Uncharacterized protein n=1 Tax=Escallonia herrerae TaxID=1293975 RepID=A0AA89AUP5_9ASTE|nr:hypothetical protein RJ639_007651 [Escallonia herrerae]
MAILNLSLCDKNKENIVLSGAIKPLVHALKSGTSSAKENDACALLSLTQSDENKVGSGAILALVNLLESSNFHGKRDAPTALYAMCLVKENKVRAVEAGIMKPLVELMADLGSGIVDKSTFVAGVLVSFSMGTVVWGGVFFRRGISVRDRPSVSLWQRL